MLLFNSIHGVEISDLGIIIFVFRPDNFELLKLSLKVFKETITDLQETVSIKGFLTHNPFTFTIDVIKHLEFRFSRRIFCE